MEPLANELTLLDYFAAKAMAALVATSTSPTTAANVLPDEDGEPRLGSLLDAARADFWSGPSIAIGEDNCRVTVAEFLASESYDLAIAMMKVREQLRVYVCTCKDTPCSCPDRNGCRASGNTPGNIEPETCGNPRGN